MPELATQHDRSVKSDSWVPLSPDEITAEWLNYALSERFPGVQVTSATIEDSIPGTCTKVRVRLGYASSDGAKVLPASVIVKGGLGNHDPAFNWINLRETRSYRDVLPTLGINAPQCYFTGTDWRRGSPEVGESILVIEDLNNRPVLFGDVRNPFTYEQATAVLDVYATIHARWWNSPEIADGGRFDHLPYALSGDLMAYFRRTLTPEIFDARIVLPRGVATPRLLLDRDKLGRALDTLERMHRNMPLAIVHGDGHGSNVFFEKDGRAGVLDLSMKRAPWIQDVAYFLGASLDIVDRRNWERALISYYLDRLADHNVAAPGYEEALLAYRRQLFYGFLAMLLCGTSQSTEEFITCTTVRFGMAMIDHDSLGLLL